MFLLVTGASGVGKSTVRRVLEAELADVLEIEELAVLGVKPEWRIAWRHEMVERMMHRALSARRLGKHFMLCGDPVPPGEVVAVPSATELGPFAVCLLDASADVQRRRLAARGDDETLIPHHIAFAEWLRQHVVDHRHRPEVLLQSAWPEMRWERLFDDERTDLPWRAEVIDTSERTPDQVAGLVAAWVHEQLAMDRSARDRYSCSS